MIWYDMLYLKYDPFSILSIILPSFSYHFRDLSGGQKARVVFVELSLMAPHLLFLDVSDCYQNVILQNLLKYFKEKMIVK